MRQAAQGLGAVGQGTRAVTTPAGDHPTQGQPLSQHRFLRRGGRRRQKAAQVTGQLLGGIQLTGQPQRPAVQHDQPWRTDQQAVGQVHLPAQQHANVLFGQQLLFREVLHQVGGYVQMPGTQRLLDSLIEQSLAVEPATGAQMQARQRQAGRPATQQVGKQVVVTEPTTALVQRHQKHLMRLQKTQNVGAVMALAQGIAEFTAEPLLTGRIVEERLDLTGQAVDHLFKQVITNQPLPAMQGLGQGVVGTGFAGCQQPESQAGDPAVAALDQVVQGLTTQGCRVLYEHRMGFIRRQAQVLFVELTQLAR